MNYHIFTFKSILKEFQADNIYSEKKINLKIRVIKILTSLLFKVLIFTKIRFYNLILKSFLF